MFHQLIDVAKELHLEMLSLYWILLPVVVILLLAIEILKPTGEQGGLNDLFNAVLISIVLLMSFDYVINNLGMLGDGIIGKLTKGQDVWQTLKGISPPEDFDNSKSTWFSIKGHILYALGIISYLIAYLGFFAAEALTHFVWICLYIIGPLMILAYVPRSTRRVTRNLYSGLTKVILWKILWTILSMLLLKLSSSPPQTGLEDYLMSIVLNLCIGVSMLLIPISCRSLIDGSFEATASMVAAAPAYAASGAIKTGMKKATSSTFNKGKELVKASTRPVTRPIQRKINQVKERVRPKNTTNQNQRRNNDSKKEA